MRTRTFAIVGLTLLLLVGAAGGLYAYDASRGDAIAKGIEVGGVDIGGLSPAEARRRLEAEYLAALQRPIVIHHDRSTWTLGAREAHIATNVDAMIRAAQARSDTGNIFQRSFRRATGGSIQADLHPDVTFSDQAVVRLIDRVRRAVNRDPQDAKLNFVAGSFQRVAGRDGLAIDASTLHQAIKAAIVSPVAKRTFVATTTHTAPKVTTKQLAVQNRTVLVVDRSAFRLRLYKRLKLVKTYVVAVGQAGLETPAGLYHIQNKAVNPAWHVPNSPWTGSLAGTVVPGGVPENPIKARWLGIWDGAGIHGVDPSEYGSLGHAASHGCVRMRIDDVVQLYPQVPVGAPIYIE